MAVVGWCKCSQTNAACPETQRLRVLGFAGYLVVALNYVGNNSRIWLYPTYESLPYPTPSPFSEKMGRGTCQHRCEPRLGGAILYEVVQTLRRRRPQHGLRGFLGVGELGQGQRLVLRAGAKRAEGDVIELRFAG